MWKKTCNVEKSYAVYTSETGSIMISLKIDEDPLIIGYPCIRIEYDHDMGYVLPHKIFDVINKRIRYEAKIKDMSFCSSYNYRFDIELPLKTNVEWIESEMDQLLGLNESNESNE